MGSGGGAVYMGAAFYVILIRPLPNSRELRDDVRNKRWK